MPRAFLKARDPFSCYSHFVGAVLSVSGLLILLLRLLFDPDISGQLAGAAVVFCLSLIALYSASSVYHFSLRGEAVLRRLKKLDHSMIYVLIAGSYTPIILKFMPAPRSFLFLGVIWLIALTGIAVKLLWIDAPRLIGTALYLALGWAIAFDFGVVLSMPSPRHCAACSRRSCLHGRRHHLHLEAAEFQHPSRLSRAVSPVRYRRQHLPLSDGHAVCTVIFRQFASCY